MNEMQIFNSEEFGQIRIMEVDESQMFVANDVAKALGYTNPSKATNDHCKKAVKTWGNDSLGRRQEFKVIPEGDIYRLVAKSQLPSAEKFEEWVFDEVLPTLRKTGSYEMPKQKKEKTPSLASVNMAAKNIMKTYEQAGVDPRFIAVAVNNLYRDMAGVNLSLPIIMDEPKLYDLTEIARELGVLSASGKPHNRAIGAIISKLHVPEDSKIMTPFERNGHSDVTIQYKQAVFNDVKLWLQENGYPTKITGNDKTFTVVYQEVA